MALLTFDQIQQHVLTVYQEVFPNEVIDTESDFFDLGGDSLSIVTFCASLEAKLGSEVHPSALMYFPTVAELSEELFAKFKAGA